MRIIFSIIYLNLFAILNTSTVYAQSDVDIKKKSSQILLPIIQAIALALIIPIAQVVAVEREVLTAVQEALLLFAIRAM